MFSGDCLDFVGRSPES